MSINLENKTYNDLVKIFIDNSFIPISKMYGEVVFTIINGEIVSVNSRIKNKIEVINKLNLK